MPMIQPVNKDDLFNAQASKTFTMIDNYIYIYHTDTLVALPLYPESIQDSTNVEFSSATPLSRTAPIYSYVSSGPRSFQVELPLHRDMMNDINTSTSAFTSKIPQLSDSDYVDVMIKELQACALPRFSVAEKLVNPPMVAIRFGNDIFCKGVINGPVSCLHSGPILKTHKYSLVTVSFTIYEVDPYDADVVRVQGGFRGLSTTLDRNIWR